MEFSELTALGTINGKPILSHDEGKPVCKFTLRVLQLCGDRPIHGIVNE